MEIKKSPKADLQNKRGLLLEIGLIIALGGVIAAFAWTPKEQKIEKLDLNIAPVEEEIVEEQPFLVAETMPSFQGGSLNDFRNWVQSKVRYPAIAQENGISGKVVLTFVIEKDGRLTNIEVLQTPDRSLSEEAIRVLNKSPKWSPGKQRNQPVRVKYTLPVDFRVAN